MTISIADAIRARFPNTARSEHDSFDPVEIGFRAQSRTGSTYEVAAGEGTALRLLRTPGDRSADQVTDAVECDRVVLARSADGAEALYALVETSMGWIVAMNSTKVTPLEAPQPV